MCGGEERVQLTLHRLATSKFSIRLYAGRLYHSFWLGQSHWLPKDSEITAKNNNGILVTIDQAIKDLDIEFVTKLITLHRERRTYAIGSRSHGARNTRPPRSVFGRR